MKKNFATLLFLALAGFAQAQYLETFSTPNKGYLLNLANDFSGVDWTLGAWAEQPPAAFGRDVGDYFQTTAAGVLESIDLDQEVCWESPLLNTAAAPVVGFSVDLSWAGFDTDLAGDPCTEASLDYIKVQYSVNDGAYVTLPNAAGGAACATIGYASGTPGGPFSGSITVSQSGIPGGGSLRIRVCENTNANAEMVTVDNINVPTPGVTPGCSAPVLSASVINITCGGPNSGSVDLGVSGGVPGYGYAWSNSATTQDLNNVPAGTYTVTVTDAAGCSATASATVASIPFSVNAHVAGTTCTGLPDGEIDLLPDGGQPPYTVNWSDLPGSNDPEDREQLAAGVYTVTVSDSGICTATAEVTVEVEPAMPYLETFSADGKGLLPGSVCSGQNASSCTNTNFFGVKWNIYGLDQLLGIDTDDYFRTENGQLEGKDFDQTICWESPVIDIGPPANGGGFAIDLSWTGFDQEPPGPDPLDLLADHIDVEYSVDGGPWMRIPNLVGGGLTGHTVAYVNGSGNNLDGAATVSASNVSGNTLRIRVCGFINAEAETMRLDNVSVPLSNGFYCPLPALGLTFSDVTCFGGSDGAVNLFVSGGTPGYTFAWSNGATTEDLSGVPAGTYTVTVTDNAGYTITAMVSIGQGDEIIVAADAANSKTTVCTGAMDGTLAVLVSGGQSPYAYAWSNGANTPVVSGLGSGAYTVTVTDGFGCEMPEEFSVSEFAPANAVVAGSDMACVDVPEAYSLAGNFNNYVWTATGNGAVVSGQGTGSVTVEWPAAGDVALSVAFDDDNGCPGTANLPVSVSVCVSVTDPPLAGVRVTPNPFGSRLNVQFDRPVLPGAQLRLTDQHGRLILEQRLTQDNARLDTGQLPAGVYYLNVLENGRSGTWKLLKTE